MSTSNGESTPLLHESEGTATKKPEQLINISPLAVGNQRLQRQIEWQTASLINVSYMVGGGIFASPALTLALVGSGGMNMVVWMFASFIALTGVCTYAELGTMLPRSGGEKEYLAFIYRKPRLLLSYLFAIYNIIAIAGGIASQSTVFGRYLNVSLYGTSSSTPILDRVWAVFVATALHLINVLSVKITLRSIVLLTVVKISVLLLIIFTGILALCGVFQTDVDILHNLSFDGISTSIGPYASALFYCMHGYSGFNAIQYSLDEVKDPIKNLPKITGGALGLTAVLYSLAIMSYMTVLSVEDIKSSELTVAASFFTKVYGDGFASRVLPVLIGLSAVGCAASLTFSGGRLILETARDGLVPYGHTIGYVNPTYKSPTNALVLQYAIVVLYLIGIGVFILRKRDPSLARPFKAYSSFVIVFILFSIYEVLFVFVPVPSEEYPYWLPYVTSIVAILAWVGLWYRQVIVLDSPAKSYNQQILDEGREELAREVYT
ncbi:methionine permease [Umbelopsis nana]